MEFPSWNWTGWEGRVEYTYWLHDIESFSDLTSQKEASQRRKRARLEDTTVLKVSIPEPARIVTDLGGKTQHDLQISSSIATFKLKLVRQQGKALRYLKSKSLQQKEAVGDQWTLLDSDGVRMQDVTGEYATFEFTDHFFQVAPEISRLLQLQNCVAELLFIKLWSFIRDSEQSDNWQKNMVGTLVLVRGDDGKMMRIASLVLPLSDWLDVNPKPAVVTIA